MAKRTTKAELISENEKLRNEIYSLLGRNGFEELVITKMRWDMIFSLEDVVWGVKTNKKNDTRTI